MSDPKAVVSLPGGHEIPKELFDDISSGKIILGTPVTKGRKTTYVSRLVRTRRLAPEEASKYKAIREQVDGELPELVKRHHERALDKPQKGRKFASISMDDLMEMVLDKTGGFDQVIDPVKLLDVIRDDIKVSFDLENFECDPAHGFESELIGLREIGNGLTILGCWAAGDWEAPVFFCVYFDGSRLRGYVPTDGNPWNTDTSLAYGNDEEKDLKNARKRYPEVDWKDAQADNFDFEWDKIRADIERRICVPA